jgi:aminopeptidase-like protein
MFVENGIELAELRQPHEVRDLDGDGPDGRRVVDFRDHSLHVLNYCEPMRARMSLRELRPHLFTVPDKPDWIPYRTSYYTRNWGFCLPHRLLQSLPEGEYEVVIDSTLAPGSLTYGELFLPGSTGDEVLLTCHVCHPSLANDNLAALAIAVQTSLALGSVRRRHGFRFLFMPATIGAIAWLALNPETVSRVRHGLTLTCLGDPGHSTYKRSRQGRAPIDRVMEHVLARSEQPHAIEDFSPYGYDERQFCSPGFDLAVGSFMRTPYGRFPQYHTSADNPDFVPPSAMVDSLRKLMQALAILEADRSCLNLFPKGELQLGRRGLYGAIGGQMDQQELQMAMLWVLNFSDGRHSLLDIAERARLPFSLVDRAAQRLEAASLLGPVAQTPAPQPPPCSM